MAIVQIIKSILQHNTDVWTTGGCNADPNKYGLWVFAPQTALWLRGIFTLNNVSFKTGGGKKKRFRISPMGGPYGALGGMPIGGGGGMPGGGGALA